MSSRFLLLVTLSGVIFFAPRQAEAAPLRVVVSSVPRCPDAARFEAFVKAAEPSAEITEDEDAPLAEIQLESRGDKFHGELRWRDGDARVAEAADCTTLARALALMVAMKSHESPKGVAEKARAAEAPPPVTIIAEAPPAAEQVEPKASEKPRINGALLGGVARTGLLGAGIAGGIGLGYVSRTTSGWPVSVTSMTNFVRDRNDFARAELLMTSLTVCPAGIRLDRVTFYGCARGELGSKTVSAKATFDSHDSLWAAAGISAQARYDVNDTFFTNVEAGVMYAAVAHSYVPTSALTTGVSYVSYAPSHWSVPLTISIGVAW